MIFSEGRSHVHSAKIVLKLASCPLQCSLYLFKRYTNQHHYFPPMCECLQVFFMSWDHHRFLLAILLPSTHNATALK